ncbi:MAG: hypothetical protein HYW48_06455 [Deltaproteobacteria bacterium]|nr:hypothetical protein [Deltaproteobacteria bacterium]
MKRYVNTLALVVGLALPNLSLAKEQQTTACSPHSEKTLYQAVRKTFPNAVRSGLFVEGVLFSALALTHAVAPQVILVKTGAAFLGYGVRYACKEYFEADAKVWVPGLGYVSLKNVACGALGGSLKYVAGGWTLDPLVVLTGAYNNAAYELLGSLFGPDPATNFAVSSAIEVPESVVKGVVSARRAGKEANSYVDASDGAYGSLIVILSLHALDPVYGPAVEKAVSSGFESVENLVGSSDCREEVEEL